MVVDGDGERLKDSLITLGFNKNEIDEYFGNLKSRLLKDGFSPDFFQLKDWRDEISSKRFLIEDEKGISNLVIFEIHLPTSYESYFSFFFQNEKWETKGMVKTLTKYYDTGVEYFRLNDRNFVSLIDSTGGTNVWYSWFRMYTLDGGGLKQVLMYPSEGQRNIWGLNYDVEYKIQNPVLDEKNETFVVPLGIDFYAGSNGDLNIDYEKVKLFSKRFRFIYVWNEQKKVFDLNGKKSDFDKNPGDAIVLNGPEEKFLITYFEDLKKLASDGSEIQKKARVKILGVNFHGRLNQAA